MADHEEKNTHQDANALRRISWGGIFAGLVVALVVQLVLGMLGLSFGAGVLGPATDGAPIQGVGIGGAIWLIIMTLAAMFAGGWTAGRLAGMPQPMDGMLHGIVTWGLVTLVTVYSMTTAIGGVLSGAASVVGQGASMAAQSASALAPEAKKAASQALQQQNIDLQSIKKEAQQLLQQTGSAQKLKKEAQQAGQQAQQAAKDVVTSPGDAPKDISQALDKIFKSIQQGADAVSTKDLANVIAERTGKSQQEAQKLAQRYKQQAQQAIDQAQQAATQAKKSAAKAAEAVASAVSGAALASFFAMIFGAIAAAVGGMVGSPSHLPAAGVRR